MYFSHDVPERFLTFQHALFDGKLVIPITVVLAHHAFSGRAGLDPTDL